MTVPRAELPAFLLQHASTGAAELESPRLNRGFYIRPLALLRLPRRVSRVWRTLRTLHIPESAHQLVLDWTRPLVEKRPN